MGSTSSKATRSLARPRRPPAATTEAAPRPRPEAPLAFESKNEADVEQDAKDPHFVEKLNQLGAVRVHHRAQTASCDAWQNMYRSRMRSEAEAKAEAVSLQPTKDRLLASSLAELLEARKTTGNSAELEALAERYHIERATLERLARVVSTPSIDESTVSRTVDGHGEESLTMMAHWVDHPAPSRA